MWWSILDFTKKVVVTYDACSRSRLNAGKMTSYFEIQPPDLLVSCYRSFAAETLFCLCESSRFRSASARSPERHESGSPRRRLSETRSAGKSRVRIHKKSARDSPRKVPTSFYVPRFLP